MTNRRAVVTSLLGSLVVPQRARAQARPRVIGVLGPYSSAQVSKTLRAFSQTMRELGYVEARDYVLVERLADGNNERLPQLANELVALNVDVIFASSTNAVAAAQRATARIPVVFEGVADPVLSRFVDSLARPGHNLTGLSNFSADLNPKRFQLLKQTLPALTHLGILSNPTNPYYPSRVQRMQPLAEAVGVQLLYVDATRQEDLEPAFRRLIQGKAGAVLVTADAYLWNMRQQIVDAARGHKLPAMYPFLEYVESGGLMSYGTDPLEGAQRVAIYIDKIFKGAQPGSLPVEQPTRLILVIDRRVANALGIAIPTSVLLQAERVIE